MSGNVTTMDSGQNFSISSDSYKVISSLFMWTLIVVIVVGNSLAIAAYCKTARLRVVTRCFIINLAVTDLLVGTIIMPFWFHYMLQEINTKTAAYKIWVTLDIACATASISNLAVVSIDRYIIISKPLSYGRLLPTTRAALIIFLVWFYALGVAVLRESRVQFYSLLVTAFSFVLPLCIMIFAYVNIFKVAKVQAHRIRRSSLRNVAQSRSNRKRFDRELKATKTISLVIGVFLFCWIPFFTATLLAKYCYKSCGVSLEVVIMVKWLQYANSAFNPIIYAMHNRDFRAALQAIWHGKTNTLDSTVDASAHHVLARTVIRVVTRGTRSSSVNRV